MPRAFIVRKSTDHIVLPQNRKGCLVPPRQHDDGTPAGNDNGGCVTRPIYTPSFSSCRRLSFRPVIAPNTVIEPEIFEKAVDVAVPTPTAAHSDQQAPCRMPRVQVPQFKKRPRTSCVLSTTPHDSADRPASLGTADVQQTSNTTSGSLVGEGDHSTLESLESRKMERLHDYNELKDFTQNVVALLATRRNVPLSEVVSMLAGDSLSL